jgi:hypothetical protein
MDVWRYRFIHIYKESDLYEHLDSCLFSTRQLKRDTQMFWEICHSLLPMCTRAAAVENIWRYTEILIELLDVRNLVSNIYFN